MGTMKSRPPFGADGESDEATRTVEVAYESRLAAASSNLAKQRLARGREGGGGV